VFYRNQVSNSLDDNVRQPDCAEVKPACIKSGGCRQIPPAAAVQMVAAAMGHFSEREKPHDKEQAGSSHCKNPL
jgi:hypothetical protein